MTPPEIVPATPRNMELWQETKGIVVVSRNVERERYSATPGDYFYLDPDEVLLDREGEAMILALTLSDRVLPICGRPEAEKPRYAMVVVVEAPSKEYAWEELGEMAGTPFEGLTVLYLGDPCEVPAMDDYATDEIRLKNDHGGVVITKPEWAKAELTDREAAGLVAKPLDFTERFAEEKLSPGEMTLAEMRDECEYSDGAAGDGEESGGVDALIDYKNALESRLAQMIDGLSAAKQGNGARLAQMIDGLSAAKQGNGA